MRVVAALAAGIAGGSYAAYATGSVVAAAIVGLILGFGVMWIWRNDS